MKLIFSIIFALSLLLFSCASDDADEKTSASDKYDSSKTEEKK